MGWQELLVRAQLVQALLLTVWLRALQWRAGLGWLVGVRQSACWHPAASCHELLQAPVDASQRVWRHRQTERLLGFGKEQWEQGKDRLREEL